MDIAVLQSLVPPTGLAALVLPIGDTPDADDFAGLLSDALGGEEASAVPPPATDVPSAQAPAASSVLPFAAADAMPALESLQRAIFQLPRTTAGGRTDAGAAATAPPAPAAPAAPAAQEQSPPPPLSAATVPLAVAPAMPPVGIIDRFAALDESRVATIVPENLSAPALQARARVAYAEAAALSEPRFGGPAASDSSNAGAAALPAGVAGADVTPTPAVQNTPNRVAEASFGEDYVSPKTNAYTDKITNAGARDESSPPQGDRNKEPVIDSSASVAIMPIFSGEVTDDPKPQTETATVQLPAAGSEHDPKTSVWQLDETRDYSAPPEPGDVPPARVPVSRLVEHETSLSQRPGPRSDATPVAANTKPAARPQTERLVALARNLDDEPSSNAPRQSAPGIVQPQIVLAAAIVSVPVAVPPSHESFASNGSAESTNFGGIIAPAQSPQPKQVSGGIRADGLTLASVLPLPVVQPSAEFVQPSAQMEIVAMPEVPPASGLSTVAIGPEPSLTTQGTSADVPAKLDAKPNGNASEQERDATRALLESAPLSSVHIVLPERTVAPTAPDGKLSVTANELAPETVRPVPSDRPSAPSQPLPLTSAEAVSTPENTTDAKPVARAADVIRVAPVNTASTPVQIEFSKPAPAPSVPKNKLDAQTVAPAANVIREVPVNTVSTPVQIVSPEPAPSAPEYAADTKPSAPVAEVPRAVSPDTSSVPIQIASREPARTSPAPDSKPDAKPTAPTAGIPHAVLPDTSSASVQIVSPELARTPPAHDSKPDAKPSAQVADVMREVLPDTPSAPVHIVSPEPARASPAPENKSDAKPSAQVADAMREVLPDTSPAPVQTVSPEPAPSAPNNNSDPKPTARAADVIRVVAPDTSSAPVEPIALERDVTASALPATSKPNNPIAELSQTVLPDTPSAPLQPVALERVAAPPAPVNEPDAKPSAPAAAVTREYPPSALVQPAALERTLTPPAPEANAKPNTPAVEPPPALVPSAQPAPVQALSHEGSLKPAVPTNKSNGKSDEPATRTTRAVTPNVPEDKPDVTLNEPVQAIVRPVPPDTLSPPVQSASLERTPTPPVAKDESGIRPVAELREPQGHDPRDSMPVRVQASPLGDGPTSSPTDSKTLAPSQEPSHPAGAADTHEAPPQNTLAAPSRTEHSAPPPPLLPTPSLTAPSQYDSLGPVTDPAPLAAATPDEPVRFELRTIAGLPHAVDGVDALALRIASRSAAGENKFTIRLDPPELGGIEIKIHVGATGEAKADLSADLPQTLDLLQRDSSVLERTLKDAGLDLSGGLSFSLKGDGESGGGRGMQNQPPMRNLQFAAVEDVGVSHDPGARNFSEWGMTPRLDISV